MTNTPTCNWPGKSGKSYAHEIYPIGTIFSEKAGNYIFCKKNAAFAKS